MIAPRDAYLLAVESNAANFDSEGLFETISGIAEGTVWNFMTGIYVFKSNLGREDISQKLRDEHFPSHIIASIDPSKANGLFPKTAWDSWFFDVFEADIPYIAEEKGFDLQAFLAAKDKRIVNQ